MVVQVSVQLRAGVQRTHDHDFDRGGISVALALSLPSGATRDAAVIITYIVVVFSILVQGLTINWVLGMGAGSHARHTRPDETKGLSM